MSIPESGLSEHNPVNVFAALGDVTRLELVSTLCDGEARSIAELANDLPLTRQAVTKHLRTLERVGIVKCKRIGRESRYAFMPESITAAEAYLGKVSSQWESALGRLKGYVESE